MEVRIKGVNTFKGLQTGSGTQWAPRNCLLLHNPLHASTLMTLSLNDSPLCQYLFYTHYLTPLNYYHAHFADEATEVLKRDAFASMFLASREGISVVPNKINLSSVLSMEASCTAMLAFQVSIR